MRGTGLALAILCTAGTASAQVIESKVIDGDGSGPYPAIAATEATLPDYAVYRPRDLAAATRGEGPLPVMVFGNGGCSNSSLSHERVLTEIASHGYVVVAIGALEMAPGTRQHASTESSRLTDAMDWIERQAANPESAYHRRVAVDRLAAPVALATLEGAGHMGTFGEELGGSFARMALDWLDWQLKGDPAGASVFLRGDVSAYPGWTVTVRNFAGDTP